MKHCESGRSMVEMLGTLAIMGLIGITGLQGFTYAMKRHRANELLNEANKRAIMVATDLMTGKKPEDISITGFPDNSYGTFNAQIEPEGNDKFKMTVTGLEEGTCELLDSLAGGPIRRINCKEESSAEIFFNNDLSTAERASDYNGNPAGCATKAGYKYCESNETCVNEEDECPQSTCEEVLECGQNGTWNKETCECDCNTGWFGKICDSDCDGFKTSRGICYPCSSYNNISASLKECNNCSNTSTPRFGSSDSGFCYLCSISDVVELNHPEEYNQCSNREIITWNGRNYYALTTIGCSAHYPTEGGFRNHIGQCYSCFSTGHHDASKEECNKCTYREMNGEECILTTAGCDALYPEGWFRSSDILSEVCTSCSESRSIKASETECDKCAIFSTPRFRDNYGTCWNCSSSSSPFTNEDECRKCGSQRTYDASTGRCKKH